MEYCKFTEDRNGVCLIFTRNLYKDNIKDAAEDFSKTIRKLGLKSEIKKDENNDGGYYISLNGDPEIYHLGLQPELVHNLREFNLLALIIKASFNHEAIFNNYKKRLKMLVDYRIEKESILESKMQE